LAELAFGEAVDRCRYAIGDHVRDAGRGAPFGIIKQQGEALRTLRYARPGERRRDVLADAIRASLLVAARILERQRAVVLDRRRGQREHLRSGRTERAGQRERGNGESDDSFSHGALLSPLIPPTIWRRNGAAGNTSMRVG